MKPASILITDDESNIRMMLQTALEADGYQVNHAANGHEALDAIGRSLPDLLVLDLNMPGMDGMAVLEHLKNLSVEQKPRVVVLTAYGSIPTAVRATQLGAIDFLEKPITPDELRETVRNALHDPPAFAPVNQNEPTSDYGQAIEHIRKSLRTKHVEDAESMLDDIAARRDLQEAEYFNLLGVLYEVQGKWRLARKCYGKAMRANKKYEPAVNNMRRLYELYTFGKAQQRIQLGDEKLSLWGAAVARDVN